VVYGLLRTEDAFTPSLVTGDVLFSLTVYVLTYAVIMSFGIWYIYKLLRQGPSGEANPVAGTTPSRPFAHADDAISAAGAAKEV